MATLGRWHNRPGGKWQINRYGLIDYQWVAQTINITRGVLLAHQETGDAPWAWLARRRAISALQRMRAGNTNEGMQ